MSFWTAAVVIFAIACVTWPRARKLRAPGDRGGRPSRRPRQQDQLRSAA